ncbi:MAG: efflux RND transporter permease subunit, partial [Gemmatimonadetes bacterium]|nr:efflux RND transporter permease subunit [Gemmatimonadota bacterium]
MMAPADKSKYKEFRLTSFAIEHATVVLVLTAIVIFLGVSSYLTVPKESSPEIVIPNIIVTTVYPGVAPRDIETLITRKLEEELNTIPDVKTITSTSTEGYSTINVEFDAGVDMDEALQRVREKVDIAKPELPTAAEEPEIFEINFAEFPIMQVNVAGPYSLVRLRDVADDLKDDLEQIPSVLEVQLSGGLEREVQVDVDLAKLQFYNLAFDDVIDAIRDENVTIPGGTINVGEMKYLVRVPGEYEDPEPIADIVIASSRGVPVYVRDVATVDFGFKERDSYARLDGNPVVSLAVKKRVGENIIETADAVRAAIAAAGPRFPPGTVVKITSDQAEDIRDMVMSLENNIISGLLLVVGVLLFFLGARTAWFVGFAIPMSMLLSFIVIRAVGFSMNMVVLFSLILALGMLVDNAIVVVENIYRFREQGFDRKEAAKYATAEVAVPVIASTATTLAAFAPMVFWPGIVGEFMKYLPLTLIITLSSSLFVALVIVPTLCALFLEHEAAPRLPLPKLTRQVAMGAGLVVVLVLLVISPLSSILLLATAGLGYATYHYLMHPVGHWFMTHGLPRIIVHYERQLRWALGHRMRMLVGVTVTMVVAIGAFWVLNAGIEFFPENIPPPTVYVQVDAPLGTRVDQTDGIVRRIENRLNGLPGRADFQSVVATTGSQVATGFGGGGGGGGTHRATVAVNFKD